MTSSGLENNCSRLSYKLPKSSSRFPSAFDGGLFSNSNLRSLSFWKPERVETMTGAEAFPDVGNPVTVKLDISIDSFVFLAEGRCVMVLVT